MAITSIKTNISAQNAANNLRTSLDSAKSGALRLSSGNKITKASDDASGLSIGQGIATDTNTLRAALSTTGQAQSILAIADGAMNNIGEILARLKNLASQANSAANGTTELGYIKTEMDQLVTAITSIVNTTQFNAQNLIDGTYATKLFQVGRLSTDTVSVSIGDSTVATLGLSSLDVTSDIAGTNTSLDSAINSLKSYRANIGALQSNFNFAANNIATSIQNLDSARAQYLDTDMADESIAFANSMVNIQAAVGVLANVNQTSQAYLKLIS
jgi:flagellin